jgi:glycosyltransferase involved in cell wall biosynthesis
LTLFFDVSRLIERAPLAIPTGIDRVDFAYASHLLAHDEGAQFVFNSMVGVGALRRRDAGRLIAAIGRGWRLETGAEEDRLYSEVRARLEAPNWSDRPTTAGAQRFTVDRSNSGVALSLRARLRGGARLERKLAANGQSTLLHCSHRDLHRPAAFRKLQARGMRQAIFIHDIIPIDYPEYCSPGEPARHRERLATVGRFASMILVNSRYTAGRVRAHLQGTGPMPPVHVVPLGVSEWYLRPERLQPPRPQVPYFVITGTIEARKNHALVLTLWRRLVEAHGAAAPRLVVVGRRGWEVEAVVDLLERCPLLAHHVLEVEGLSDSAVASLTAGAVAVLQPSHVEGFGLPLVEAQALNVPVLASDIDAHRELAAGRTRLLDPLDGPAWYRAIEAAWRSASGNGWQAGSQGPAVTWNDHVGRAIGLLADQGSKRLA